MFTVPKSISVIDKKVKLYKRSRSNVWQTEIKLQNGKRERFSTGTEDENEAKEKALKLFYGAETRAENKLPQNTRKFRNVANFAINRMQSELDSGSGKIIYNDYIRVIKEYLLPFFGNYNVDNINVPLLADYSTWRDEKIRNAKWMKKVDAAKRRATTAKERNAADNIAKPQYKAIQSTINTHNSALNRVLDEALQRGWITESIKPTLLNKGVKSESRGAFTQEEYKHIYSNLAAWAKEGHRRETREIREVLRDYVLFLSNTGVRHGTETEALRWKNVSWYIEKTPADKGNNKSQKYLQIDIVKGKTGKRTIIARDMTAVYLERLLKLNPNIKQKTLNAVISAKLDEPLFVTRSGLHVSTDTLRASFKQYLNKLNLRVGADNKVRSLYSLRHTYATLALLNGRSIHQLAVQMGNSTAIIEQYYSKLSAQLNASEHSGRKQFDTAFAIDQLDGK